MTSMADLCDLKLEEKIFTDVNYYTSGNVGEQIIKLLDDGGAQRLKYFSDFVSHVICGSSGVRESDLSDADDVYEIPAVSERWVLTCARAKALVNTKGFLYTDKNLFSSLVVTTSGLLPDDRNAVWAMVTYNGGVFTGALDGVTHLICTSTKSPKYLQCVNGASGGVAVVTPDWIVECLKAKALVPHEQYHPKRVIPLKTHSDTSKITGFEVEGDEEQQPVEVTKKLAMDKLRWPWNADVAPQQNDTNVDTNEEEDETKREAYIRKLWKQMPWNQKIFGDVNSATSPPRKPLVPPQSPVSDRVTPVSTPGAKRSPWSPDQQQQQQQVMQSPQSGQMLPSPQSQQQMSVPGQIMQSPQHMLQSPQHPMPSPQQPPQQQQQQGQGQIQNNENSFLYKYIEQNMQEKKGQQLQQMQQQGQQIQQVPQLQQVQMQQPQQQQQVSMAQQVQGQQQISMQMAQVQQVSQGQMGQQQAPNAQQSAFLQQMRQRQQQKQAQLQQQQQQQQQGMQVQQGLQGIQQVPQQQQIMQQPQQHQQLPQPQGQMRPVMRPQMQPQQQIPIQMASGQRVLINQNQHQLLLQQQQQKMFNQQQMQIPQSPTQQQQNLLVPPPLQQQQQQIVQGSIQQQMPQQKMIQQQQMYIPQQQQQQVPQQQMIQQQNLLQQQQQPDIIQQHVVTQPQMPQGMMQQQPPQSQGMMQQQVPMSQHQLMSPPPQQVVQPVQQQVQQQQIQGPNMTPPQQLLQSPQGHQQKVNIMQQQQQQQLMQQSNNQNLVMQQQVQVQQPQQQQQQGGLIMGQQFRQQQNVVQNVQQGQFIKQGTFPQQFVQQQQQQGAPQGQVQGQQGQFIQNISVQNVQNVQNIQQGQFNQQVQVSGQQIITQSPTQTSAGQGPAPVWQQQVIRQAVPGGPTGARFQFPAGQHPQRQYIQLDAQTHHQLQQMAPEERAQFVQSLRAKQRAALAQRQQQLIQLQQQQQRAPGGHIVVRGQVPPGLTPQQHVQWLQQHKQGVVLQQNVQGQPGLSPIQQNVVSQVGPQSQTVPGVVGQFDQTQIRPPLRVHQLQLQREQVQAQAQNQPNQGNVVQIQGMQGNKLIQGQHSQQQPGVVGGVNILQNQVTAAQQGQGQGQLDGTQFTRGKTALANMLSIKMSGGQAITGENLQEPSAAGTLRLMTAQHNAALNNNTNRAQEILALQQQQQQQAGARRLNPQILGDQVRPPGVVGVPGQTVTPPSAQVQGGAVQGTDKVFSPRSVLPIQHRPGTYYGHNPNLKLPPDLFLLGCIFVVVEIEDLLNTEVPDWAKIIEKHGGEIEKQYCSRITHVLCMSQRHGVVMQALRDFKRCVTAYWLSDVILRGQVLPPWMALHLPAMNLDSNPASKHLISYTGFVKNDRFRVKTMIDAIGATGTSYLSQHNTLLVALKPDGIKCAKAKLWNVPVVNVQWLTEVMLGNFSALNQTEHVKYQQFGDQANFCFDPSLVPTLMQAWKMPINISQESYERVKRSVSPVTVPKTKKAKTEHADSTEAEKLPEKEERLEEPETPANPAYCIHLSNRCSKMQELKDIIKTLGGSTTKNVKDITYFVVTKLLLTQNVLLALCQPSVKFVTEAWLYESHRSQKFIDETPYIPDAKEFNQLHGCDFNLTLATANRHRLLEGRAFFVTPQVTMRRTLVDCITAAGGIVERVRRSGARVEMTQSNAPYSYIIIADDADLHLVGDLLKRENKIICTKELITSAIVKQTFEVERYLVQTHTNKLEE